MPREFRQRAFTGIFRPPSLSVLLLDFDLKQSISFKTKVSADQVPYANLGKALNSLPTQIFYQYYPKGLSSKSHSFQHPQKHRKRHQTRVFRTDLQRLRHCESGRSELKKKKSEKIRKLSATTSNSFFHFLVT